VRPQSAAGIAEEGEGFIAAVETMDRVDDLVAAALAARTGGPRWSTILKIALPALVLATFLFLWNEIPTWVGWQEYTMPTFSEDVRALVDQWGTIGPNLEATIVDALLGFILGNLVGIVGAILFSQSKYIQWAFYPLAIVVQTIPVIVLVPIIVVIFALIGWDPFSSLPLVGVGSKPILAITVLISFFPTLVNMTVGLQSVDPDLYDLARVVNANRWTILWRLRLPSSMPYLFSSFKISATACFIGAIVGEWMLSNNSGIGGLINLYYFNENKTGLWASVIAVCLSSMAFFGAVSLAERVLVPWRRER
jgi:NitT/TauT family transport system permease protein